MLFEWLPRTKSFFCYFCSQVLTSFLDFGRGLYFGARGLQLSTDLVGVREDRVFVRFEAGGHFPDSSDLRLELPEAGDALVPGLVLLSSQVHFDRLLDCDQGLSAIQDLVLKLDDRQGTPIKARVVRLVIKAFPL